MVTKKQASKDANGKRTIKKYPNRRLYDTQTSTYVTLSDVKNLVMAQEDFCVVDAKTGEDLTRSILLQIILEEEAVGAPLFTENMLSQMIRFYGHSMQGMLGNYLENNMQSFIQMQNQFADQVKGGAAFTPENWVKFMSSQNSMGHMMEGYMEQSKSMFAQMQEAMTKQGQTIFSGFPFNQPKSGD